MTRSPSVILRELALMLSEARPDCRAAIAVLHDDIAAARVDLATESRITRRIGDWTVREALPALMRAHRRPDVAAALEALAPIVDQPSAAAAGRAMGGRVLDLLGPDDGSAAWAAYYHAYGMLHDVARAGVEVVGAGYMPERFRHIGGGAAEVAAHATGSRPVELLTELLVIADRP